MTPERTKTTITRGRAVGLVAFLGVIVLLTTLPTWVQGSAPTATGDQPIAAAGTVAVPAAASVGLVVMAAALVLGLAGRGMRIAALIGVVIASIGAGVATGSFLADPEPVAASAAAQITSVRAINTPVDLTLWPFLCLTALTAAALAAGWLLARLGTWAQVGRRYERAKEDQTQDNRRRFHQNEATNARLQAMDDWDAITRGEDPT